MLSNVDIIKQLGKNIAIHPLTENTIKGSSINLTASPLAWSIKTKKPAILNNGNGDKILLKKHDTTLVLTNETLGITTKIGGTYHSRVYNASIGIGHIGTTLNPGWVGPSLVALHNHTDDDITIDIGSPFVTVVLCRLNRPSSIKEDNLPSRTDILQRLDITLTDQESNVLHETPEYKDFASLCKAMYENKAYKDFKKSVFAIKSYLPDLVLILVTLLLALAIWFLRGYPELAEAREIVKLLFISYLSVAMFHIITKRFT